MFLQFLAEGGIERGEENNTIIVKECTQLYSFKNMVWVGYNAFIARSTIGHCVGVLLIIFLNSGEKGAKSYRNKV